jgi:hypothetical protein
LEDARELDKKTLDAWVGHPHVVVAPNLPNHSFEDKINVIIHSVKNMVGEQLQKITNHKLLIKKRKYVHIISKVPIETKIRIEYNIINISDK